ncbi:uncharacterized protein LOC119888961 [Micropterus salmoides]|uniref:uncharacterized protein LOC119888961 n=1 Tax=Micropterus salmoides TaxID=27706 RepID=UPI0018ED1E07|nr:uncharacterized protein LOC119888961 [Micropterus salmoides]
MRATVIDHVIVHGMTMAEAGLRVRPNLSRFTVATIIRAFTQHNRVERMPHRGGRVAIFTAAQETLIVDMVRENNLIRLREIRDKVIADNVSFHRTNQIREWFTTNSNPFLNVCLPPYSPFLNPIEEFFSSWRWKVYDRQPYTRENLLRAMELACVDIPVENFQGWIRHSRAFFPRCLARDNIACDVDEVMWPDAAQRHDAAQ